MRIFVTISLIVSILAAISCQEKRIKVPEDQLHKYKEPLVKANKYLVKKDDELIRSYVKRRQWDMTESKTGLWYSIYEHGTGRKAETDKYAVLNYSIELLDGRKCYSSDSLGAKSFKLGMGSVESGLEEGLLLMREGDKARFIMPPHLAHGLLGDDFKIPPHAIIVYYVELLQINDSRK